MTTPANVVVSFGSESDLLLELDDELNDGASEFPPGRDVFFLIHAGVGVEVTDVLSTFGAVEILGSVTREKEIDVLFTPEKATIELGYEQVGGVDIEWIGNQGGQITVGKGSVAIDAETAPAAGKVSFKVRFVSCVLQTTEFEIAAGETFPVTVVTGYK